MRSFEASIRLRRLVCSQCLKVNLNDLLTSSFVKLLYLATFDDATEGEMPSIESETVQVVVRQLLADRTIARGTVEVMAARKTELDGRYFSFRDGLSFTHDIDRTRSSPTWDLFSA